MCGRYSMLAEDEIIEIRTILHDISLQLARDELADYEARDGEVRPTDRAPVIAMNNDGLSFENAVFGFKKWDGKGVIINARSETIQLKSMFSNLLMVGRCVVPAREYYEWKVPQTGKKKAKYFVKDKEGNLLFFAGLYRDTDDGREFVIITKAAVGEVAAIHDRMPVILRVSQLEPWLGGESLPGDIAALKFNADVAPCEDAAAAAQDNDSEQLSLFFT